ncbi:Serine phosphatase RsbU regulator of sigma subunit [Paramagnetospirillum magnetotacticum MS-1]|uniref:Serine phosphatase RsbU regulator of sigma subunit n=1 Tax=Paramagnetospirillum magnetotacticum MS-1 TaxID=272627 RepID=A0A0C2YRA6_PARME|nr:SpoIIE family protein phosphatase [Paramagnetospirillum magnetotacticum]KIL97648.1 Serine phosphatase RsbU regulator of sigma subunit [Paramagnetospirillum magnetotacticum MS-1]
MNVPTPPSPPQIRDIGTFRGLSFKQAVATLVIALGLGAASGVWELSADYQRMRLQVVESIKSDMALVRGTAVEAAYMLSHDLAGEVVSGLALDPIVAEVRLADNFGDVLGETHRPPGVTAFPALAERLFGDIAQHSLFLQTRSKDNASDVGKLELHLDPALMLNRYLDHVAASAASGVARTVILCLLVVAVFYGLITKPLLKIGLAVAKVNPARPGDSLIELPRRHEGDELGMLVRNVNALLAESQRGLDGRDTAEGALAALARNLELRVQERTHELEQQKAGVERANAELEKANRFISDGIRYASRIQTALLPDTTALDGAVAEFTIGWRPFDIVGGDYYWTGTFGDKTVVAVMDCTGHGVPGAFMTAVVSSILARILHHHGHDDPAVILALLNFLVKSALRQDRADAPADDGLDAAICVFDQKQGIATFAGANLPLMVWSDGHMKVIRGDRRSLGYRDSPPDATFASHEVPITPGAIFYLYTDGLIDHMGGPNCRLFGRKRLQETLGHLAGLPLDEQKEKLFATLDAWRGDQPCRDDMTFIAIRPKAI